MRLDIWNRRPFCAPVQVAAYKTARAKQKQDHFLVIKLGQSTAFLKAAEGGGVLSTGAGHRRRIARSVSDGVNDDFGFRDFVEDQIRVRRRC
jgi:hypothetical protein